MDVALTSRSGGLERLGYRILESIPMAVLGLDNRARVRFANRAALRLLERTADALLGQDVLLAFGWPASLEVALAGPTGERRLAFTWRRPDGPVDLGMSVVRVRDPETPLSAILVFRMLASLGRGERDMLRLERAAAVGRLAKGLAHEIRNPLAAIQGLSENLLAELHEEAPAYECARRIVPLVRRIDGLIRACMDFSVPERPRKEPCAPIALVESALAELSARWEDPSRAPRTLYADDLPRVWADPVQVTSILKALLDNALDSAQDTAAVELVALVPSAGGGVLFEVRDQGGGIPEGQLDRVFEPFFTTKPDSSGLGLTVARALALQNDALLEVRSKPGETVFGLTLPVAEAR